MLKGTYTHTFLISMLHADVAKCCLEQAGSEVQVCRLEAGSVGALAETVCTKHGRLVGMVVAQAEPRGLQTAQTVDGLPLSVVWGILKFGKRPIRVTLRRSVQPQVAIEMQPEERRCVVSTFDRPGALGLGLVSARHGSEVVLQSIKPDTQAASHTELRVGSRLVELQGTPVADWQYLFRTKCIT